MRRLPEAAGHWLWGSAREVGAQPHRFVSEVARKHGGIAQFRILHRRLIAVAEPEHAHHIFISARDRYRRAFQARNIAMVTGDGLLASDGELWESHRRVVQPVLHSDYVRSLVPSVRELTSTVQGGRIDAVTEMQRLTIAIIVRSLFAESIDTDTADRLGAATREASLLIRKRNLALFPTPQWTETALHEQSRFIHDFVSSRLDNPECGTLLQEIRKGPLSRQAILDEARTLLVAGFETTAVSLSWTLYLLARHPEAAQRWYEELDNVLAGRPVEWEDLANLRWTNYIVHESMRVLPPVYTLPRRCIHDDEIDGYFIPKGSTMLVSIYGIHRSSGWGDDAESFRPERFGSGAWPKRAYMPFGLGKHVCAGNRFAMTEVMTILACIGQRFRLSHLEPDEVEPRAQVTLVPSRPILLNMEPR